jgi:hypothetical protein
MKRRQKRLSALLLAGMMTCLPAIQSLAMSYDVTGGLPEDAVLFPGDSLTSVDAEQPFILDEADASADESGTWTNVDTDRVYLASSEDGAGTVITTAGYVLVVENGTSDTDDSSVDTDHNHNDFLEEEDDQIPRDMAYYPNGVEVTITAEDPDDGMEFSHWECSDNDVKFADANESETTLTMPDRKVTVTAVYQEITVEEPAEEEPVAEEPVAEEPVAAEEPAVEEPIIAEEPAAEEPAEDQLIVVEDSVVEEPVCRGACSGRTGCSRAGCSGRACRRRCDCCGRSDSRRSTK